MSNDIKLNSAAAVEVAAFCWPAHEWRPCVNPEKWEVLAVYGYPRVPGVFVSQCDDEFNLAEWESLHRAAAVLVGRGGPLNLASHLWEEAKIGKAYGDPNMTALMVIDRIAELPAEAWARAILATVREVAK